MCMPGPSIFQKISFLKNRRQFQRQENDAITLTRIRGLSHVRIIGSRTAHEGRRGSDLTAVSAVRSGLKRSAAIGRPGIGRMGTIACNAGREKKKRTVKDRQSKQRSKIKTAAITRRKTTKPTSYYKNTLKSLTH